MSGVLIARLKHGVDGELRHEVALGLHLGSEFLGDPVRKCRDGRCNRGPGNVRRIGRLTVGAALAAMPFAAKAAPTVAGVLQPQAFKRMPGFWAAGAPRRTGARSAPASPTSAARRRRVARQALSSRATSASRSSVSISRWTRASCCDLLQQQEGLVFGRLQFGVLAVAILVVAGDRPLQRGAPEFAAQLPVIRPGSRSPARPGRCGARLSPPSTAGVEGGATIAPADHAEAMAAGRLHDPPASARIADARGAQRLQARGLGIDVVGFDIQVQARS